MTKSAGILFYEMMMSIFQKENFNPNIAIQAHDLQTVLTFVSSGRGISLSSSLFVPVKGIVMRGAEDVDLKVEANLAWRIDNQSEILEQFLKFFEVIDIDNL